MGPKVILGVVLSFLVVIFIVQNTEVVAVRILFWELSMSRAVLIFLVLVVGIILGWVLGSWARFKKL